MNAHAADSCHESPNCRSDFLLAIRSKASSSVGGENISHCFLLVMKSSGQRSSSRMPGKGQQSQGKLKR